MGKDRKMNIYVVRWLNRIDNVEDCGKFDYHDWWIDKLELKVS